MTAYEMLMTAARGSADLAVRSAVARYDRADADYATAHAAANRIIPEGTDYDDRSPEMVSADTAVSAAYDERDAAYNAIISAMDSAGGIA